jgi:hypothetical protein
LAYLPLTTALLLDFFQTKGRTEAQDHGDWYCTATSAEQPHREYL